MAKALSFHRYYETWFDQLNQLVHQLQQAKRPPATREEAHNLHQLVAKTTAHYAEYYKAKSKAAEHDVLSVFSAPWCTNLERSLHWIAGWRPITVFHLVYTESSILFESNIVDLIRGLRTGDLGDLSPFQLSRVSELQCQTVEQENAITDEFSEWQDGAVEVVGRDVDLEKKLEKLVKVLGKADELRLRTINRVVELLTPQQAAEFLIAAAQLLFGIRQWGADLARQLKDGQSY